MDMDTPTASSLVITIPVLTSGDQYTFPDTPPLSRIEEPLSGGMESGPDGIVITYNGTEPIETYVDLLRSFQYQNTEDEPGLSVRSLTIQVFTPSDIPGENLGSNVATVSLEIRPLNDNPPIFTRPFYSGRVSENAPVGTLIGITVAAEDGDVSLYTNITFSSQDPFFTVDRISGVVSTLSPLDAETSPTYEFVISTSDNDGANPLTASVAVLVNVTDVNDNPPVFNQTLYTASVREDVEIGDTVLQLLASDSDISAENSGITYMLAPDLSELSGSGANTPITPTTDPTDLPFEVDPFTGAVNLAGQLDFEEGPRSYDFMVLAADSGPDPLTAQSRVRIRVLDVNDNAPEFINTIFTFDLQEDTLFPSTVVSILAQDADTGANGQVQFSLEGTTLFSINPTSGLLLLVGPLDYETNSTHTFDVVITDLGFPRRLSARETIVIRVGNVNDNSPTFSQPLYAFTVAENTPFLLDVSASDADDDVLSYREISGFVPGIQLEFFDGDISGAPLNFEERSMYLLVIEASDGMFPVQANVTITVRDENDLPPLFSEDLYAAEIPESLPVGASVLQVLAMDGDQTSNAIIEYSLESQNAFEINNTTGLISVRTPLDFDADTTTSYLLNVTARNIVPPYFEDSAMVLIDILDVNDLVPTLFLDELNVTFPENSAPVSIASEILVRDGDSERHPLAQCTVVLVKGCSSTGLAPCDEVVFVDTDMADDLGLSIVSSDDNLEQTVVISGNVSESVYQSVLRSLRYGDISPEPLPGPRTVSVQCRDNDFTSNELEITITVVPLNEFCPSISASLYTFNFTEGSGVLALGSEAQFTLTDADIQPHDALGSLRIILGNRLDTSSESISLTDTAGLTVQSSDGIDMLGSGQELFLTQTLVLQSNTAQPISVFQRALRSLVYTNMEPEPTLGLRVISIIPVDMPRNCTPVEVVVNIIPVNDNPPQLLLVGNSTLEYEEESGELAFADEAGLMVSDLDHNALFPMQSATVVLNGTLDGPGSELLGYDGSLLPAGVTAATSREGKSGQIRA